MRSTRFSVRFLPLVALVPLSFAIADSAAKMQANTQQSQDRLFHLGVALLQYSDDYDGHLPPMTNAKTARQTLRGYALESDFLQPGTSIPYAPNPALSGKSHADFNDVQIWAFSETKTAKDKSRNVLFLPRFDPKIVHYEENSGFVRNSIKTVSKAEWRQSQLDKND